MTDKKYERYYGLAGKASYENWDNVKSSQMCGCYYCCRIFPSSEVTDADWVPDLHGRTVTCPYCYIDSVIGDVSGIPLEKDVLEELYDYWFGSTDNEKTPRCVVAEDCRDLLPWLETLGVEAITQADPDVVLSEFIPDSYIFSGPDPDNKRMASELRTCGTTVLWCPSHVGADGDTDCAGVSDIILFTGGDPADTRLADAAAGKLFVRTLGKHGLLYRFRDGAWMTLRLTSDDDIDFDAAADRIAADIVYELAWAGKPFEALEDKDAEKILTGAMQYLVELSRASAH